MLDFELIAVLPKAFGISQRKNKKQKQLSNITPDLSEHQSPNKNRNQVNGKVFVS
jgi:hypothetical protein